MATNSVSKNLQGPQTQTNITCQKPQTKDQKSTLQAQNANNYEPLDKSSSNTLKVMKAWSNIIFLSYSSGLVWCKVLVLGRIDLG